MPLTPFKHTTPPTGRRVSRPEREHAGLVGLQDLETITVEASVKCNKCIICGQQGAPNA